MTENISPVPNITDEYAAGFFDGEGSVSIHHSTRRDSDYVHHTLLIRANNTNIDVLFALQKLYGGYVHSFKPRSERNQPVHEWTLRDRGSEAFLRAIFPYVIVKKPHIEIALEYISTISTHRTGGKRIYVTPELWEKREALVQKLDVYNRKGQRRKKVTFHEYVES